MITSAGPVSHKTLFIPALTVHHGSEYTRVLVLQYDSEQTSTPSVTSLPLMCGNYVGNNPRLSSLFDLLWDFGAKHEGKSTCLWSTMKCQSVSERWAFEAQPVFLYTQIILHNGDDYFWTRSTLREHKLDITNLPDLQKIPREHIFPPFEDSLEICKYPERKDTYIKRPRLSAYRNSSVIGSLLLQEARTCQVLMKKPHPNIVRYLGCVIQEDRMVGLCFERYTETLRERLERNISVSEECFRGIEAGIQCLHSQGLVHNDIGQDNIMFRHLDSEEPVIIDFDSCVPRGSPLPAKRGRVPDGIDTAEFRNDDEAARKIRTLPVLRVRGGIEEYLAVGVSNWRS